MEFKGTKENWRACFNWSETEIEIGTPSQSELAIIDKENYSNDDEAQANALLISKAPEMLRLINAINNSLCGLLLGDDLTEEELRNASENLLPTIQSDCARLIKEATDLK